MVPITLMTNPNAMRTALGFKYCVIFTRSTAAPSFFFIKVFSIIKHFTGFVKRAKKSPERHRGKGFSIRLCVAGFEIAVDGGEIGGREQQKHLFAQNAVFRDDDRVNVLAPLEGVEHVEHRRLLVE